MARNRVKNQWHNWQKQVAALPSVSAICGTTAVNRASKAQHTENIMFLRGRDGRKGQILCDGQNALKFLSKPVILLVETLFLKGISPRCGPCNPLGGFGSLPALIPPPIATLSIPTAHVKGIRSRSKMSAGPAMVALLFGMGIGTPEMASAQSGWTTLSSGWSDEAKPKIASLNPRLSSTSWAEGDSFDERSEPAFPAPDIKRWKRPEAGSRLVGLRSLITLAESHKRGYDAIHGSATRLPAKRPTELTIAEILAWIDATPGQHHAIGFYQIIPSTLKSLIARSGISPTTTFTPKVQDYLGEILLADAGYNEFVAGKLPATDFMDNLAKIWAGFPMANGRSAYHGKAGNRATIKRAFFETEIGRIFGPAQQASLSR